MLNYFRKLRRDRGDSVLVTVIIAIPLFMLAFMFSVGLAMNAWQKTSYADSAQAAAQTAASSLNTNGWLGEKAINTFVSEYMRLTDRTSYSAAQIAAGGYSTKEAGVFQCNTVNVNGTEYASPYIEIRLDRTRGLGTSDIDSPLYVSVGGSTPTSVFTLNTRVNYRVISATVYEASSSLMGDGFAMMGEDAGCFTSRTEVSGITFGANEDISNIGGDTSCWVPSAPTNIDDEVVKTNGSIRLYSGADYTCPVSTWLSTPYLLITHEYGSFYRVTVNGNNYWVNSLDVRPADQCSDRPLSDRRTTIATTSYSTGANSNVKTYSAPFEDCLDGGVVNGTVSVNAKYTGVYGTYLQLTNGRWVKENAIALVRTVNFNANGGSGGGTVTTYNGATVNAPANPTRTGYTFAGWYTSASGGTQVTFPRTVTANVTYYARWSTNAYSISWNGGGGSIAGCGPTTYNVSSGTITPNSSTCTTKTRNGYTFAGWSPTSIPAGSTGNRTFTAQWNIVTYPISYNFNGGSGAANCGPTSYRINSGNIAPTCTPTRGNYDFIGWSPGNIPTGSTGARTFTAQWALKQYTVSFNGRGGTNVPAARTVNHGNSIGSLPSPTRSGWTFWGWSTNSTAQTSGGTLANQVTSSRTVTSNMTLYAHWYRTTAASTINTTRSGSLNCVGNCNLRVTWTMSCPSGYTYQNNGSVTIRDSYSDSNPGWGWGSVTRSGASGTNVAVVSTVSGRGYIQSYTGTCHRPASSSYD